MGAMIVTFGTLLASVFASNFYLGQSHNAIETDKLVVFRNKEETAPEVVAAKAREAEDRIRAEMESKK